MVTLASGHHILPVQHHGREPPVGEHRGRVLVILDLVRDHLQHQKLLYLSVQLYEETTHPDFLQNEIQFSLQRLER